MILSVSPSKLNGEFTVPGSKSHTIRAIAIAMLAEGESVIRTPLVSEDTLACLRAASSFGAMIDRGNDTEWHIVGTGGRPQVPAKKLDMENSGTGLRIFTAIGSLLKERVGFYGDDSLSRRQMEPLLKSLNELGASTESTDGHCPISVRGPLNGGTAMVDGTSSQYLTALLLACPLVKKDSVLDVPFLNERPYVGMTLDWLKKQNIRLEYDKGMTHFSIQGNQKYHGFKEQIAGDFSTAAFPITAAVITGGSIRIDNLDFDDPQGDKAVVDLLSQMGAKIEKDHRGTTIKSPKADLHAVELDLNAVPDLLPILAVAAACADGTTVLKNVRQARLKECDRIAAMATELGKMGIRVEEFEDGLAITGGRLKPARINSHHDHRIAMALAIAGMACRTTEGEQTIIDDAECIRVTYPAFVKDFAGAGAQFDLTE